MPTLATREVLSVFLASPSDVAAERATAQEIVNDLNKRLGPRLRLQIDLHMWEDIAPGYGDPQNIINPELDECDLFIGLLWEKWGQRTKNYSSGFEEEFERAIARRKASDRPDIMLAFKAPRPEKLDEPGPQLTQVLTFRETQKAARQVLFADVRTSEEWGRKLQTWLLEKAFDAVGLSPRTVPPAAESLPMAPQPLQHESVVRESQTHSPADVPDQLRDLATSVRATIYSGHMEWSRDEARTLSAFDIARLHLLSTTWMAQRYTSDFLGTHEVNLLYKNRAQLQATTPEHVEILRTLLADESDFVPGWFWFKNKFHQTLSDLLLAFIRTDPNDYLRVRSLKLLTDAKIEIPSEEWANLPLSDNSGAVRTQALEYLGAVGDLRALPLLENASKTALPLSRAAAIEATLSILARHAPQRAFAEFLSAAEYTSRKMVPVLRRIVTQVVSERLVAATANDNSEIRLLCVTELSRRGELPIHLAEKLRDDPSLEVRQVVLQKIVNTRGLHEIQRLRASQKPDTSGAWNILAGRRDLDLTEMTLNYCRTRPTEELLGLVQWLGTAATEAYKVLAIDRFESISPFIRSDLDSGFDRIRLASLEDFKSKFGPELAEQHALELDKGRLNDFIRSQFTEAALAGLAVHGQPSDVAIARRHLLDDSLDVKTHSLMIIGKFGGPEDVEGLVNLADKSWGEVQALALATAIRLAANSNQLALEMANTGTEPKQKAALAWLIEQNSPEIREHFRALLNSDNSEYRTRALCYLAGELNPSELDELLESYLQQGQYYYDVATWLDRILYAPQTLKPMYLDHLQQLTPG